MQKPTCLRHPTVALVCPACVGRKGGKMTSRAKTAAARANARRPRPGRSVRYNDRRQRWVAHYRDPAGKRHTRNFRSQREAYSFVATIRREVERLLRADETGRADA